MKQRESKATAISISVPDCLFEKINLALGDKNHQYYSLFKGSENRDVAVQCSVYVGKSFSIEFLKPDMAFSPSILGKLIKSMSEEFKFIVPSTIL